MSCFLFRRNPGCTAFDLFSRWPCIVRAEWDELTETVEGSVVTLAQ